MLHGANPGNVVGSVTPLPRHSDEFSRLSHFLAVSCRSTAVTGTAAWAVATPSLTLAYERRSGGLLALDCWVDCSTLDSRNPVQVRGAATRRKRRAAGYRAHPPPTHPPSHPRPVSTRYFPQEVCKRGFLLPMAGAGFGGAPPGGAPAVPTAPEGLAFTTGNIRFDLDGPGASPRQLRRTPAGGDR